MDDFTIGPQCDESFAADGYDEWLAESLEEARRHMDENYEDEEAPAGWNWV